MDGASLAKRQTRMTREGNNIFVEISDGPIDGKESFGIYFDTVICKLKLNDRTELNNSTFQIDEYDNELGGHFSTST